MPTLIFSGHKHKILEFNADALEFERQPRGLLVSAQGNIAFQDTPTVEEITSGKPECNVTIINEGETVVDARFQVTFYTLEPQQLVVELL